MDKRAILVVSFGTTDEEILKKTIGAVERTVAAASGGREVRRAFTGAAVIRKLHQKGIAVDFPLEALDKLCREGFRHVTVLPTFLAPGGEYRRLQQLLAEQKQFENPVLLPPLMEGREAISHLAAVLRVQHVPAEGQALLFMGHGTDGEGNDCYRMLEEAFDRRGTYVALLKGNPDFDSALKRILAEGFTKVRLVPLMLSAGAHAAQHWAGKTEHSWAVRCKAAGLEVSCEMRGLGELETVRQLYADRLKQEEEA